jgi:diguanylate cyclase (GGDEF)-like protein/PAS domain S-box-containing protein
MKNILIIDNSLVIKNLLIKSLSNLQGIVIFQASSVKEVEKLLINNKFFIVISNLVLSDSSNFEILKLLKKENIPTIIFSSNIESTPLDIEYPNIINHVIKDANGFEFIHKLVSTMVYCYNEEVLLVDDSRTQATYIKEVLEKLLLKVTVVKHGIEALDTLNENKKITLILTDYEMPVMDGLELTKRIREHKNYNQIPIIITTNINDNNLKIKFYRYGANDILIKPVLKEELISKIIDIFLNQKYIEDIETFNELLNKNIITSTTDASGKILTVSEAFCKISGYTKDELIGKNHNILRHPEMPKSIYQDMWTTIRNGVSWEGEIKNLKKNGDYYWVKAAIEPTFSKDGDIIGYSAIRYDITDKKKLEIISITDGLTNIYNRRFFNEIFPKIINNAKRKNELICFLFMDIDYFKLYNDNYGHQKGDDVLINFAKCLKDSLHRFTDFAFRLGGEEFAIIYQIEDKQSAIDFANTIRQNIQNLKIEHKFNSASEYITASMGLICKNAIEIDYDEIYKEADDLLYEAKKSGRNQIKVNS